MTPDDCPRNPNNGVHDEQTPHPRHRRVPAFEAMIHYHGTPVGGRAQDTARFLVGRHALVSYARPDDMAIVADVCSSFVLDNGAFSLWKRDGGDTYPDFDGYVSFVKDWARHPGFDWALIPDNITGNEDSNDQLLGLWNEQSELASVGVPVWHLHESIERLQRLVSSYRRVAFGSSGKWAHPGTQGWWGRVGEAMSAICDDQGRPPCRLHGLRMLDQQIFQYLPFASADSTNAVVNAGSVSRFGQYRPPSAWQRAAVIADRIESVNSSPVWVGSPQIALELVHA